MTSPLKLLFAEINQAKDKDDLRSQIAPKIGEYFLAKRSAIFYFEQLHLENRELQKIVNVALSVDLNPIARYIVEHHSPTHEGLVVTPKVWSLICPRLDHWHVMAGPIVNSGQLVGAVGCTREKAMTSFNAQNLVDLSAICLHLSAWLATNTFQRQSMSSDRLTPRELQIAELVALGRTNAQIGMELWITENSVKQALKRIFRKLEVSSRAEMVGLLSTKQYH